MSDVASDVIAIIAKKKRVEKPTVEITDKLRIWVWNRSTQSR